MSYVHEMVTNYRGQFLDEVIRGTQGSKTDGLGKLGEIWIRKQRYMTKKLMANITAG